MFRKDNSWATQVYLIATKIQEKTQNTVELKFSLDNVIRSVNFSYAFCKDNNGLVTCTCCMGKEREKISECEFFTFGSVFGKFEKL
jgi:hypothetical protein